MSSTYFLSCKCGTHNVRLGRSAHDVLVADATGFFERVDVRIHNLGWSLFADGFFETSRVIAGEGLLRWIAGIREALRRYAHEVPTIFNIISAASEAEGGAYLKVEGSYWMVEAVVDQLIAKPVEAATVAERVRDPDYRATVVSGAKALFPEAVSERPQRFHPTQMQLDAVFDETDLQLITAPIGSYFALEIQAITDLAEHAAKVEEPV